MTHENKTERISPMQNDGDNKDSFRFAHPFPHPLSCLPRELKRFDGLFLFFPLDSLRVYIHIYIPHDRHQAESDRYFNKRLGNVCNMMISRTRLHVQLRKQHPTYRCKYVLSTLLLPKSLERG